MPVTNRLRVFSNFVALWDTRLRNPAWVLEYVSRETLEQREGSRGNSAFYEDPELEERFRSKLTDYKASVYCAQRGYGSACVRGERGGAGPRMKPWMSMLAGLLVRPRPHGAGCQPHAGQA